MSEDEKSTFTFDGFTLGPDWGKNSAGAVKARDFSGDEEPRRDDRRKGDRRDGPPRRDMPRRDGAPQGRGGLFRDAPRPGDKPRFSDAPQSGGVAPRRDDFRDRPPRRDDFARRDAGAPPFADRDRDRVQLDALPYEIRFLPEQGALDLIALKITRTRRAIPLQDLVKLFYANPDTIDVRLEFREDNKDGFFYRCKKCGFISFSAPETAEHIRSVHFAENFTEESATTEPPKGTFKSVMRDGFSGKLLGPPNHHSFALKVAQAMRESSARNEDEFRARLETITDPEIIEQWKNEAAQITVYTRIVEEKPQRKKKGKYDRLSSLSSPETSPETPVVETPAETAPAETPVDTPAVETPAVEPAPAETPAEPETPAAPKFSYEQAMDVFNKEILPLIVAAERVITLTHQKAKLIKDEFLSRAISVAWDRERRIMTAALFFAIRGGLRGRGLSLFRISQDKREEWVSVKMPASLDASLAVAALRSILEKIREQPEITKVDLLAELAPESAGPETANETRKQFNFALDRGYIIEAYNGALYLGSDYEPFNKTNVR